MGSGFEAGGLYECSGLRISSAVPLYAPLLIGVDVEEADLTIELGESRTLPFERPSTDLVAELITDGHPRYTICRVDGGYVCRIMSVADFVIDADLSTVTCHPAIGGPTNVIPIVITGTIVAFVLAMGGRCVLHGSAVEMEGNALAFVGESGQGKSTMAAIFCAAGASLVTDDVLPLEIMSAADGSDVVHCLPSANEIRLREKASSLAYRFDRNTARRLTADERLAVAPLATALDRIPLAAVVLPRPDRGHSQASARLLPRAEASFWLNRCQRIEGWRDREYLRRQFVDIGRLASVVPVYEVSVPWGPPFADSLFEGVLHACGLDDMSPIT